MTAHQKAVQLDSRPQLEAYLHMMVREGLWSSEAALRRYLAFLFRDVELKGKSVLDIGGGTGLFSFYAAVMGAQEVVCLEPETDGASDGTNAHWHRLAETLELENVKLEPVTFQSFRAEPRRFDVLLLHNSVNHLDEPACIELSTDKGAMATYQRLFSKLAKLGAPNADLILADCSPRNFWPLLGLRHPLSRSIEWHKHQPPEVWELVLRTRGFGGEVHTTSWSSYNRLGRLGWLFFANRVGAFFLTGHFRLHMRLVNPPQMA